MFPYQQMPNMPMMAPFGVMNKMALAPALYVGDVDETIQEEFLYDFFSKYGALHFVRIMRDHTTGKSRGYGFVNFINPRDAENAKQLAQYEKLGKKHIRIMFKRPIKDLSNDANIYVKNIDPSVNVKELHNHFNGPDNSGGVLCAKIATNSEGQSLGYGYVQFEKPEDAARALQNFQGSKLKETQLVLSQFLPRDKRTGSIKRNIYVKNLPNKMNEEELNKFVEQFFSKYGKIDTMLIKKHPTKDEFSAFICYVNQENAEAAVNELKQDPPKLDGENPLYINWHQSKVERERELKREHAQAPNYTNLYLKNLRLDVTEQEVKQAFQTFGKVTSVAVKEWVAKSGQRQAKYGFVAFESADDASRAINEGLDQEAIKKLYLQGARPYIGLHQSKDKRQQFLLSEKRRMQANMQFGGGDMYRMPPFAPSDFNFPNRRFQAPVGFNYQNPMFKQSVPPSRRGGPAHKGWDKGPNARREGQQGRPMGQPRSNQLPQQMGAPQPQNARMNQMPNKPTQQPNKPLQKPTSTTAPQQSAITVQNLRSKLPEFLALDQDKQRQILGELLFPLIRNKAGPDVAPKITGMLIDLSVLEVTEILEFLEDPDLLAERVEEAKLLLDE
jgi:polyadenylate-binding protein